MNQPLIRRPVEFWALRMWPLTIVLLWIIILPTGGLIGYTGWLFKISGAAGLVTALFHSLKPYNTRVRYMALVVNELAFIYRSLDYALAGQPWKIALVGFVIWGTIAVAKFVVFMLTAGLVELHLAVESCVPERRKEGG